MTTRSPLLHSHLLLKRLLAQNPSIGPSHHLIYLVGEKTQVRYDTDRELPFRQESNFAWLSGCEIPGSALTVSYEHDGGNEVDVAKVESKLWLPEVDPDEVMWCGLPATPESLASTLNHTSISAGWTPVQLASQLLSSSPVKTYIHHLPFTTPPKQMIARINGPTYTSQYLLPAIHAARRNKTAWEVEQMRKANEITSGAHKRLMEAVGKGEVKDEGEAEAEFVGYCRRKGAKHQAYTPIMAGGSSAGTLHYIANDQLFPSSKPGALLLVDAGAEFNNYAGDVTRCIPIGNGGRFTEECADIYSLVLEMQEEAFKIIGPGTNWEDVQLLMHKVATRGLLKLGIFAKGGFGGSEDELVDKILESGLSNAFFPHGVGHLLGLDVHDVGGLPEGKSKHPLMRYLRLRVPLEEGFVVTVEPGIYFNEFLFAAFKNSEYVNQRTLQKYWYVGGVRIEDNLLITKDGFENLTTAPKTIEEVEKLTAGKA
ncbi:Xaa-Pro dipeptidase [Pseudohyphozyma bogoriensis]|nr:Xaa-Pro dipeptidase [Pseudohyphozyma bogoriensis]